MPTTHRFVVGADDAGLRLDQLLAKHVPGLSRRKARVLVDVGGVFVDRARVKIASRALRPGQTVEVHLGGVLERATGEVGAGARARDAAQLPAYAIVYEDDDVVVVDKPAGLVTAPTPESDRGNLADLLARRPGAGPVHVVHRLDRPTSGVLVLAKTEAANRVLSEAFAAHAIEREYRAVVLGALAEAQTIDRPIEGRRAVTRVAPLQLFAVGATLLACRLETGRSHQIRIHLADLGHPVLGDHQHGGARVRDFAPRPPRLALHATILGFTHPRTGARLRFERPLPPDLATWLSLLGDAVP
jgi:23S rRNA pseudouridine1911/1915/1917 synthase